MATKSTCGGLLGVPLPASAGEVTLYYRPRAHRMARVVCLAGIIAGIGLIAADDSLVIGIFMTFFDVHINRIPYPMPPT